MNNSETARSIFEKTLRFVDPEKSLPGILNFDEQSGLLNIQNQKFEIKERPVYLIGTGKASHTMAKAVEEILAEKIVDGLVISPNQEADISGKVRVMQGTHPLPDQKSVDASRELINFTKSIPDQSVVMNLVSGGTSSLFCLPAEPLTVDEIREVYKLLIESGATIHQINTVRKPLSQVKGGRFLSYLNHTTLIDLIISDIPDDDLTMVGSGPSIAQKVSPVDAISELKKLEIFDSVPSGVRDFLEKESEAEKKKPDLFITKDFKDHHTFLIASAGEMAKKAGEIAEEFNLNTIIHKEPWSGPIEDLERLIIKSVNTHLNTDKKTALIFFGEPTVHVTGDGLGGRNQELALRMAFRLQNLDSKNNVVFLSAGTDGIDGPTDAAGAVVDTNTIEKATEKGLDAGSYLEENDSYHFFEKAGGHIKTGPTGNNLMDLQVALIVPK